MKKTLRRRRPQVLGIKRYFQLSKKESGTWSMPSGDTAQAALWAGLIQMVFQTNYSLMVIPLVALGRIYFHCHYIGDTIVGASVGYAWAYLGYSYFSQVMGALLVYV